MVRSDRALVSFALDTLRQQCEWQPFDFVRTEGELAGRHEEQQWRHLEAQALAADTSTAWLVRVVFVTIEDVNPVTEPAVIGFPTAPCREELIAAIYSEAQHRGLLDLPGGLLAWNDALDVLEDVADYAPLPAPLPAPRTDFGFSRHGEYLRTAAVLMARAGEGIAPRRRSRLTA